MKHPYYPALDGLRTIAVGIVLCAHGGVPWFRSGGVGVDIFFVLSGFLITTILSTERQRTGAIAFRNFYARRFLRLAPALVLTCAVVAVAKPAFGEPFPGTDIAFALSYTANWVQALYHYHLTWLNHCWSLAIEEQFYLIWPLVILGVERIGRSPAAKAGLLLGGAAVIAVYRAWHVGVWTDERINFGLDTRMDSLMTGAALAYAVQAWRNAPGGTGAPRGLAWVSPVLGRVLAPLALVTLFLIPNIVTWYSPWMGWIGYVLVAGLAATVLADLVLGRHSLLAPVLATRPMVFVGKISYGLYLLHLPVYFAVEKLIPEAPLAVRLGWKVSVSLALATASYFWLERRFLALKSKFDG
ncbi:acyltransferase [Oleiharenicola lentus]|uniref:Acyltransferase n=1 Tax=Oleiharenicola lentus TaxID=2508720 RepID=A0A4Q1C5F2_9BACT|nr:acyltransferase [Oleiharenicola lentus]RXK53658.1 acyltransferase [Oleiharenicola lentus]